MESAYAAAVLDLYLNARKGRWLLHGLDVGVVDSPSAMKIRDTWEDRHIEWAAVDVKPNPHDGYVETWEGLISGMEWADFDFILNISTMEHCAACGDSFERAINTLRGALTPEGVMVLTMPVGVFADFEAFRQYTVSQVHRLLSSFQVIDERFWRWGGEHFENCREEDVLGCVYGQTNNARNASGVGAWTLAR